MDGWRHRQKEFSIVVPLLLLLMMMVVASAAPVILFMVYKSTRRLQLVLYIVEQENSCRLFYFSFLGWIWLEGAAGAADEMSWALARRHVTSMSSVINRVIITDPITY